MSGEESRLQESKPTIRYSYLSPYFVMLDITAHGRENQPQEKPEEEGEHDEDRSPPTPTSEPDGPHEKEDMSLHVSSLPQEGQQ